MTADLTAIKAMLLDALQDATVIGGCGTNPHYPGNSIGFGHDGEYASAVVDGDKLAATVAKHFAPIIKAAELEGRHGDAIRQFESGDMLGVVCLTGMTDEEKLVSLFGEDDPAQQSGNGFEMLFELKERIVELEAAKKQIFDKFVMQVHYTDRAEKLIKELEAQLAAPKTVWVVADGTVSGVYTTKDDAETYDDGYLTECRVDSPYNHPWKDGGDQ
jgi:hypothetical protein